MAMTEEFIQEVTRVPITEVLADFYGIQSVKKGNRYWCNLRDEKTPSCCIYPETNSWCDFGDGNRGGNVINLVQYLSNLDFPAAVNQIAGKYGIRQLEAETDFPTDYEFRQIGITPDLATKNFNFDIARYSDSKNAEFAEKYRMSVKELSQKYPQVYHNMLRSKALPFVVEQRNLYYQEVYNQWDLAKNLGISRFTKTTLAELETRAKEQTKKEKILKQAITNPNLLKFNTVPCDPQKDLEKILNGQIQIQAGNVIYSEMKRVASADNKNLSFREIPYQQWQEKSILDEFQQIEHAAYINAQSNTVNLITFRERENELNAILGTPPKNTKQKLPTPTAPKQTTKYNTVVINLFAGPGAGKTTCAWEIAAELKKAGIVTEYVSEAAKEYVWENRLDILDGSLKNQSKLFQEQNQRVQRLMGKVAAVVTDSPILLNSIYLKESNQNFENEILQQFSKQKNFNIFIQRGKGFEQEGRLQNRQESVDIDKRIENLLQENNLYYGKYTHAGIRQCVENIKVTIAKANGWELPQSKIKKNDFIAAYCSSKAAVAGAIINDKELDITK